MTGLCIPAAILARSGITILFETNTSTIQCECPSSVIRQIHQPAGRIDENRHETDGLSLPPRYPDVYTAYPRATCDEGEPKGKPRTGILAPGSSMQLLLKFELMDFLVGTFQTSIFCDNPGECRVPEALLFNEVYEGTRGFAKCTTVG